MSELERTRLHKETFVLAQDYLKNILFGGPASVAGTAASIGCSLTHLLHVSSRRKIVVYLYNELCLKSK